MTIHLTPEQEQRIQAVLRRGSCESVDEVLEAALAAVEQRTVPCFDGTEEEMAALLAEGLASKELTETEFWKEVNQQTDAMLAEYPPGRRSVKVAYRQAASDNVARQFRYYLVTRNVPEVAIRFRDAIRLTVQLLRQNPFLGPHYPLRNPQLRDLRFWPVAGFEAIGIY